LNKLFPILACGILASSSVALYYRHEFMEARAPASTQITSPREAPTPAKATTTEYGVIAKPEPLHPALRQHAEQFLARYEDTAQRGELLEQTQLRARRDLEGFDKERKIDSATFEDLVRLQSEYLLTVEAAGFRCTLDPNCSHERDGEVQDRYIEAVDALIGQGGYFHVRSWTQSLPTRRMVNNLSSRLPVPLTTAEANALLDALATERSTYIYGYSDSRQRFAPFTGARGMEVLYSRDASSVEDRMASARAYSRHIRGLAATVLKGEQLRTFNRLQDEALRDLQPFLRSRQAPRNEGS
jgi:hypothetical protein